MTSWLEPVRRSLDGRVDPIALFVRDDDAGWEQGRLERLIHLCATHAMPLDLAVIPSAIDTGLATMLRGAQRGQAARLGLHQHGWSHTNHEAAGRKCEFGVSRSTDAIAADIEAGQQAMARWFGSAADPIFTPPWNRCTAATARALRDRGFTILSRDATAPRAELPGLIECPTTIDWFAKRHGVRLGDLEWAVAAAREFAGQTPVGLLLHHAVMDDREFDRLDALFALVARHAACRPCSLVEAARAARASDLMPLVRTALEPLT